MLRNQKGMTLVELLTAITLLSLIIVLVGSIHLYAQKQFVNQSEQVEQQSDVRNALSSMSRAIRTTPSDKISVQGNVLHIDMDQYYYSSNLLMKNDTVIADDIASFRVTIVDDQVVIDMTSDQASLQEQTTIQTKFSLRK
ncbi:PilW family protein [Gracilibacillus massiliensis]|uniref:PilW family protein n=1 Tax=Gracilibacillus massiliensis TaxID=1564956 RepID=UPI00071DF90E|nr:prepilin-type N-terminal cleavage/methylation domain-containing protein [Gracilibacillus massiliensis]